MIVTDVQPGATVTVRDCNLKEATLVIAGSPQSFVLEGCVASVIDINLIARTIVTLVKLTVTKRLVLQSRSTSKGDPLNFVQLNGVNASDLVLVGTDTSFSLDQVTSCDCSVTVLQGGTITAKGLQLGGSDEPGSPRDPTRGHTHMSCAGQIYIHDMLCYSQCTIESNRSIKMTSPDRSARFGASFYENVEITAKGDLAASVLALKDLTLEAHKLDAAITLEARRQVSQQIKCQGTAQARVNFRQWTPGKPVVSRISAATRGGIEVTGMPKDHTTASGRSQTVSFSARQHLPNPDLQVAGLRDGLQYRRIDCPGSPAARAQLVIVILLPIEKISVG